MSEVSEIFDKTVAERFIKIPPAIFNYVYVPGFRQDHVMLYAVLVDMYNAALGYAYPTQDQLAIICGKSTQAIRRDLRALVDVELVRVVEFDGRNNYGYVPLKPLEQAELWRKWPEAAERYREAHGKITAERQRNRAKMARLRRTATAGGEVVQSGIVPFIGNR